MQPNNYPSNTSKPRNIHDFIRSHKALSIIIVIAGSTAIIGLIILISSRAIINAENSYLTPEDAPIPYFEHRYLLDYNISESYANDVLNDLSDILTDPEEIGTAPIVNPTANLYTFTFDEESFVTLRNQPQYTYAVNLLSSDDRTYTLYIRLDPNFGQEYLVAILDRTDLPNAIDYVLIYTNPDLTNRESTINSLTTWANSFTLTNPTITTDLNLNVPEK